MDILSSFWILSCTNDGGAYHYTLGPDLSLTPGDKISLPRPTWGQVDNGQLCLCFRGNDTVPDAAEGYVVYDLASRQPAGPVLSAGHGNVCYFCRDGADVYLANYGNGTLVHHTPDGRSCTVEHQPRPDLPLGCNAARQERPHVHQCIFSPDKRYVLVCDLGLDTVFVYDRDLHEISHAAVPSGHGARHSLFSHDGKTLYALGEMGASISRFRYADGQLTCRSTVSIRPDGFTGTNDAAALLLSPDERFLYATNRGADTIAVLRVEPDGLTLLSQIPCGGQHPRDLRLIAGGRYALCCNQFSDSFTLFSVQPDGQLLPEKTVSLPAPLCVCEE